MTTDLFSVSVLLSFPECSLNGMFYKWTGFLHSAYCPWDPSVLGVATFHSCSRPSSTHGVDVSSLFGHLPVEDTLAASGLWLLHKKLPRAVMPRLCVDMFSFLGAKCPGVQVPGDMVGVRVRPFQEVARFLQSDWAISHSQQHRERDPSPCVLTNICIVAIFKSWINILVGRPGYLIAALICISLMANDIECLFRCLFAVRLSLVKCLVMPLPTFWLDCFLSCCWVLGVLYTF